MSEWPQDWVKVTCQCGQVIGGYNSKSPPDLFKIAHACGYVTVLWPTGAPTVPA